MKRVISTTLAFVVMFSTVFFGNCVTNSSIATVTATAKTSKSIKLKEKKVTLIVGKKFTQKLLDKNGKAIAGKKVKWETKNKKIATVSKTGVVKAVAKGTTKIIAKYKGKTYKFEVKVKAKSKKTNKNTSSNGFKKLKNYINDEGFLNENYDYAIKEVDGDYTFVIVADGNTLEFLIFEETYDIDAYCKFGLKPNSATPTVEYLELDYEYDTTITMEATMKKSTYNLNKELNFKYVKGDYISSSIVESTANIANIMLHIGFMEYESMIEDAGVTMADLGFTSY